MSIEAMKQALEALESERDKYVEWGNEDGAPEDVYEAITSLRQAISEAEKQEPVAWQVMVEDEAMKEFPIKDMAHDWCVKQKLSGSPYSYWTRPLYTTPQPQEFVCSTGLCHYTQPQRTWVGLTDEEYLEAESVVWITINLDSDEKEANRDFYQAIEAKLKEKNFKE